MAKIALNVDGKAHTIDADPDMPLLYALRDDLGLRNPKFGCGLAQCGACTVHVDGNPMYSCSQLAVWMDGKAITTVEGLEKNGKLDPLQQSFIDFDAPQCGFCTSGFLMLATGVLEQNPNIGDEELVHALSSNLCRCTGYQNILKAVKAARDEMKP